MLKGLISSGSFAKCYLGSDETCGKDVAIKVIPEKYYRPAEVDALISCGQDDHKAIAQYYGTYRKGSDIWIVQELGSGCELSEHIAKNGEGLDELLCCDIFTQLIDAVQHIHGKQFIHGDLKPENVIIATEDSHNVKLVDFGAAW